MSKREDEDFSKWLGERVGELKGKDPEAAKQLEALANSEAGRELYRGSIREADYYRRLNEFGETKKEEEARLQKERSAFMKDVELQNTWFEKAKPEHERALVEAKKAETYRKQLEAQESKLKELGVNFEKPVETQVATPPRNEELDALIKRVQEQETRMTQMDRALPVILTELSEVAFQANKEGFNVPPSQIMKTVFSNNVSPLTAYQQLTSEERTKRAQDALDKRIADAKEEGKKEALSSLLQPGRLPASSPSMIDTLRSGEAPGITDPQARRDASMMEFMELVHGQES